MPHYVLWRVKNSFVGAAHAAEDGPGGRDPRLKYKQEVNGIDSGPKSVTTTLLPRGRCTQ